MQYHTHYHAVKPNIGTAVITYGQMLILSITALLLVRYCLNNVLYHCVIHYLFMLQVLFIYPQ